MQIELNQPDYYKKFVLNTDVSNVVFAAVLTQDSKRLWHNFEEVQLTVTVTSAFTQRFHLDCK